MLPAWTAEEVRDEKYKTRAFFWRDAHPSLYFILAVLFIAVKYFFIKSKTIPSTLSISMA
jgi:hypothetical protein